MLRFLFFTDVQCSIQEDDLVASHLKLLARSAVTAGIPARELVAYVESAVTVSASRARLAAEMGTPPEAAKQLLNMLGYGNSAVEWQQDHKVLQLPDDIGAIKRTLKALVPHLWDLAPEAQKQWCNTRQHPQLTNISLYTQVGEREKVDAQGTHVGRYGSRVCGYIFDSVVSCGGTAAPPPLEGVEVKRSPIGLTRAEFQTMVEVKLGRALDWTSLPGDAIQSRRCAIDYAAWLYDKSQDELRGGRPLMDAAEAVAGACAYSLNPRTGHVEHFDHVKGVWHASGGEHVISGKALTALLQEERRL